MRNGRVLLMAVRRCGLLSMVFQACETRRRGKSWFGGIWQSMESCSSNRRKGRFLGLSRLLMDAVDDDWVVNGAMMDGGVSQRGKELNRN